MFVARGLLLQADLLYYCVVQSELLYLQEQWQADMDKIFSEYEVCKSDKDDFEGMVDRLSREMEDRVEGLKAQHIEELTTKDNLIRELYTKVGYEVM